MWLVDLICVETSINLTPTPHVSPLSSPFDLRLSLNHPNSTFVEFEIFFPSSHCLNQTRINVDIERLQDHMEVENLTVDYPTGIG